MPLIPKRETVEREEEEEEEEENIKLKCHLDMGIAFLW